MKPNMSLETSRNFDSMAGGSNPSCLLEKRFHLFFLFTFWGNFPNPPFSTTLASFQVIEAHTFLSIRYGETRKQASFLAEKNRSFATFFVENEM